MHRFLQFSFILSFLLLYHGLTDQVFCQDIKQLRQSEDSLAGLVALMQQSNSDSTRLVYNEIFRTVLEEMLMLPESGKYPFSKLKNLVRITSEDKRIFIVHWNLPMKTGKQRYFGYLISGEPKSLRLTRLTDVSDSLQFPDTTFLDAGRWFGALYYKVIMNNHPDGKKSYTLLGWSGKNSMITQKVIEVLTLDDQDNPRFGLRIFPNYLTGNMTRIIFRYDATTAMSLKYEEQTISSTRKWNSGKRAFDQTLVITSLIVFDHLAPIDPQLEGQYQFYVPSGDIFDGFIQEKGKWMFLPSIDARNKH